MGYGNNRRTGKEGNRVSGKWQPSGTGKAQKAHAQKKEKTKKYDPSYDISYTVFYYRYCSVYGIYAYECISG